MHSTVLEAFGTCWAGGRGQPIGEGRYATVTQPLKYKLGPSSKNNPNALRAGPQDPVSSKPLNKAELSSAQYREAAPIYLERPCIELTQPVRSL